MCPSIRMAVRFVDGFGLALLHDLLVFTLCLPFLALLLPDVVEHLVEIFVFGLFIFRFLVLIIVLRFLSVVVARTIKVLLFHIIILKVSLVLFEVSFL